MYHSTQLRTIKTLSTLNKCYRSRPQSAMLLIPETCDADASWRCESAPAGHHEFLVRNKRIHRDRMKLSWFNHVRISCGLHLPEESATPGCGTCTTFWGRTHQYGARRFSLAFCAGPTSLSTFIPFILISDHQHATIRRDVQKTL